MSHDEFKKTVKQWINHKLILARRGACDYTQNPRRDAIFHVKSKFSDFLMFTKTYNVSQLALKMKQNEELLMNILPIPNNPSYDSAKTTIETLLATAHDILKEHNLLNLLNG
jgi:hypothetical protein